MPSPSLSQAAVVALTAAATVQPQPAKAGNTSPSQPQNMDLHTAIEHQQLTAEFRGNGRDTVRAILTNRTAAPLTVRVPAGQMFESGSNVVIVLRSGEVELRPAKPVEVTIQTAATRSANKFADRGYTLSYGTLPRLDALLAYAQEHAEVSTPALQTAVLALTENLPLSAVSKFSAAGGDLPTHFDTNAFRAETNDIIHALLTLRAIGVRESDVAMNIDPQLKIEAMIEPLTRPAAMRYYGITPSTEWGPTGRPSCSPATRAPATTPSTASRASTRRSPSICSPNGHVRPRRPLSSASPAIQAMADTQRPEALPVLQKLSDELGAETELGRAAANSAKCLNANLAKLSANRTATVAFRSSSTASQF
ncbi:MAG: hypothetical protein WDN28_08715 [Chthoniobacter sp.]